MVLLNLLLWLFATEVEAKVRESFTSNSMCRKNYCINPIFPGLKDLDKLEKDKTWVCHDLNDLQKHLGWCKDVVNYHSSVLKYDDTKADALKETVMKMEDYAITIFTYHISGMGLEFWDYQNPSAEDNPCVESVWRLACYTAFPRAPKTCKKNDEVEYIRPCRSSCHNYIRTCQVECCDESVQCVFRHVEHISADESVEMTGFYPDTGPSPHCTGSAFRARTAWLLLGLAGLYCNKRFMLVLMLGLMISTLPVAMATADFSDDIAGPHKVGNWRLKENYLKKFAYFPPGAAQGKYIHNSCSVHNLAHTLSCSGHGVCNTWDNVDVHNPVRFCNCDPEWADPECRTRRKSKAVAYTLALFIGFTGADQFYLGYPISGAGKLATLGGFGLWWVYDIVRIGSESVYARDYRVDDSLPKWVYVCTCTIYAGLIGFVFSIHSVMRVAQQRRKGAILLMAEETFRSQQQFGQ